MESELHDGTVTLTMSLPEARALRIALSRLDLDVMLERLDRNLTGVLGDTPTNPAW